MPADEGSAEMEERLVEVIEAFVADEEASVPMEPGEGAFDDPAISAEFGLGLDAFARDAWDNLPLFEGGAARLGLVRLVGVEFVRALTRRSGRLYDRRDGVNRVQEDGALVDVRCRLEADEGDTLAVSHQMVLGSRFAAIGRIGAHGLGRRPPFFSP